MKITIEKVKQYNSTKKYVVIVDSVSVVVCNSEEDASKIISYLDGYNVDIHDNSVLKILDDIKENGVKHNNNDITITRLRKYKSGYVRVVTYNSKPILITKSLKRAESILEYLYGRDVKILDGAVVRILNKLIA